MSTPETQPDFDDLITKHSAQRATLGHIGAIVRVMGEVASDLRAEIRRLESLLVLADGRIRALEAKATKSVSGVTWAGTFTPGATYSRGELVTKTGLWLALKTTTATPGTDPASWRLIVHRKLVSSGDDER